MTELCELAFKYGSDKCPQIKHPYTECYYNLLKDKRQTVKKVLEMGILHGASLFMWRDFFPNAKIYGADIRGSFLMRRTRMESFQCDQSKKQDLVTLVEKTGSDIDLFIDDGSHRPEDQISTCLTLMPLLKRDVIYIIEDVVDPSIAQRYLGDYDYQIPKLKHKEGGSDEKLIIVRNKMAKTSIIIPSRGETGEVSPGVTVLQRTVADIYEKATGEFEVLVGFDGPPYQDFPNYPNLKVVKFPDVVGIKTNINALAAMATGKYLYKTDAHCSFGKGFDEILQADMRDDWIVTPRFYVLDGKTWEWQDDRFYDYFYLCCPFSDPKGFRFKAGGHWPERTKKKLNLLLDETPQIHGSGWFISKDHYFNFLGGFPNIDPHGHAQEPIWLGLKNWLGGGQVMVNKKTWYAHLHQQGNKRGYHMNHAQEVKSYDIAAKYWVGNKWAERKHDFDWFVDKFMPMPTWPENWRELYGKWKKENGL